MRWSLFFDKSTLAFPQYVQDFPIFHLSGTQCLLLEVWSYFIIFQSGKCRTTRGRSLWTPNYTASTPLQRIPLIEGTMRRITLLNAMLNSGDSTSLINYSYWRLSERTENICSTCKLASRTGCLEPKCWYSVRRNRPWTNFLDTSSMIFSRQVFCKWSLIKLQVTNINN